MTSSLANGSTFLFRQIPLKYIKRGRPSSLAFTPMPKDDRRLSCYDGSMITAEQSYYHFLKMGYMSSGVLGVTVDDCIELSLFAESDPRPFPEHAVIVFPQELTNSRVKTLGQLLRDKAVKYGWQYKPED